MGKDLEYAWVSCRSKKEVDELLEEGLISMNEVMWFDRHLSPHLYNEVYSYDELKKSILDAKSIKYNDLAKILKYVLKRFDRVSTSGENIYFIINYN